MEHQSPESRGASRSGLMPSLQARASSLLAACPLCSTFRACAREGVSGWHEKLIEALLLENLSRQVLSNDTLVRPPQKRYLLVVAVKETFIGQPSLGVS